MNEMALDALSVIRFAQKDNEAVEFKTVDRKSSLEKLDVSLWLTGWRSALRGATLS
tara:strand:+ start:2108 stop:2275 length:168 start_codon:yes stop_codon:yes gene_type:complete